MDHNHRDRGDACLRLLAAGGFSSSAHSDSRLGRGLGAGRPGRLGSRADPVRQVVFHSREGDGTGHERDLLKDSEPGVRFWNSSDRWHHPVDRVTGVALGASWGFANAGDTSAEGGASSGGEIWGSVPGLSGANLVLSRPAPVACTWERRRWGLRVRARLESCRKRAPSERGFSRWVEAPGFSPARNRRRTDWASALEVRSILPRPKLHFSLANPTLWAACQGTT